MAALKVLSIAVASGRAGFVCLTGGSLTDWGGTVQATKNTGAFAAFVQTQIDKLTPDVVVAEDCDDTSRKGGRTRTLISVIAEIARHNQVLAVSVVRPRRFRSKYEEAQHFAARYPELAGYRPQNKRRIFEVESRNLILFEALVLAEDVINGQPDALAAAMG